MGPVGVGGLGDGDEVSTVEDGGDAVNVHELGGQRRGVRRRDCRPGVEILDEGRRHLFGDDPVVRQELEGVRVRGVLGLDEDGPDAAADTGESRSCGPARCVDLWSGAGGDSEGWEAGSCAQRASPSRRCSKRRLGGGPGDGGQDPGDESGGS